MRRANFNVPVVFQILLGAFLCCVQAARAADIAQLSKMSLEQLLDVEVVTVSKYGQKISETPSSVTVISKQQIKQFGHRTLSDVLRSVRGFFITSSVYDNAGVRGFNQTSDFNGRILVMIDGMRINEPIFDDGFTGSEFPLDIDLVERVEVVRGPGSSIYGGNAFFAVVNVITKNGRAYQGAEIAGTWGSFNTYKGRFSYGRKHDNGLEYLLSATNLNSDGPALHYPNAATASNPSGQTVNTFYEHGKQFFAKAQWGDFSLVGGYARRKKGLPGGAFATNFNDPNSSVQDSEAFLNLQYQKAVTPHLQFTGRAFYGDYDVRNLYQYGNLTVEGPSHAWWSGFELRLLSTHFDRHTILSGIEVQENWLQEQSLFLQEPYLLASSDERNSHRIGIYLQDDIRLTEQLKLTLGARFDDYSLVKDEMFSPRAGLVYQPLPGTTFKLNYGKAFRAPNYNQQYQAFGPIVDFSAFPPQVRTPGRLPNPGLKPELIETYDLTWEQIFAKNWVFSATGYYLELRKPYVRQLQDFGFLKDAYNQYINDEPKHGYGAEFELNRRWDNGALFRTSYSLQYAKDAEGKGLDNTPRHVYQLNFMTPLFLSGLHGGIELQALSKRHAIAGTTPGYTRVNLNLLYQPVSYFDVSAGVYDLFDSSLREPNGIFGTLPQEGRSFRLKFELRF